MNDTPQKTYPRSITRKSAARLAAVQVLFQLDLFPETRHNYGSADDAGEDSHPEIALVEDAIRDLSTQLLENKQDNDEEGLDIDPDVKFLTRLACGTTEQLALIDPLNVPHLTEEWKFDRLDPVLRAVLRCGAYELKFMPDVPKKVVINEYVDVTSAFSEKLETGFVNKVLDRIAGVVRDTPASPAAEPDSA